MSAWRRFSASGGPCRTANTPALGRAWFTIAATSPQANTSGCEVERRKSSTRMKPSPSTSSPEAAGQDSAAALVTQRISSAATASPSSRISPPGSTRATARPSIASIPRAARIRANLFRVAALWAGSSTPAASTTVNATGPAPPESRCCTDSASSTPPAPPPTTAIRAGPSRRLRRSASASQWAMNPPIGLTGTACSAAPGTSAVRGAEPMSIETTS